MYIPITTHSAYSLREALPLPDELAQAARADGMPAIGLMDRHLFTGAVKFVAACKRAKIQPVLGRETAGRPCRTRQICPVGARAGQ